eukprot:CAMPEP_0172699770 /NCGR_PEP_ID=MMETSP1074-20121228/30427_1 /TAXON_ID=2916 /ORGANISM="Ceratium fusus, Strain PA161109" /LENGTH=353 /DNA_ID=CAMNT_0013521033 /DNA_START=73 /DNA_END=1131 /DNA_ORIENTATION=-
MRKLWYMGVVLEVVAGMCGAVGKLLVSFSARTPHKRLAGYCYWCGLSITTFVGPALDASAFSFASQSIVAPLNGLGVCWTALLAPITLGDSLASAHLIGAILVSSGGGLTAVFGPHGSTVQTLEDARVRLYDWPSIAYVFAFAAYFVLGCVLLQRRPVGVGDKVRGVLLGALAGGLAGNMYFCSCTTGILRHSIETGDWQAWTHWLPYALATATLSVALGNIPFMARGLQEYEALFMVTLFEGCHILFACISAAFVLKEMDEIRGAGWFAFWMAVVQICVGLYILQTAPLKVVRCEEPPKQQSLLKESTPTKHLHAFTLRDLSLEGGADGAVVWASTFSGVALTPRSATRHTR